MDSPGRDAAAPSGAPGAASGGPEETASAAFEWALVERAQRGDATAFRTLVEGHQARAYGLALRIVRSPLDAEEVAQDAFVRAWLALARFRGESSFATWLYRIVARRAFDRAAALKTRRGRETETDEAAMLPAGGEAGVDLETKLRTLRLERLVLELPEAQRTAVTLYYYEDRSVRQVAETLAIPENTVKTHLSRARATLRRAWQRRGGI